MFEVKDRNSSVTYRTYEVMNIVENTGIREEWCLKMTV